MLVSYSWLQEYVKTTTPPAQLGEKFLMTSSEIERLISPWNDQLRHVVTGKVLECEQHPQADRLKVTKVEVGSEIRTIVCGAPNVKPGITVLVALPGAEVTSMKGEKITIAETPLRGVVSQGMLCAAQELGLPIAQEEEGLWVLPASMKSGVPAAEALELTDTVLDLEITPNRPDLLSYLGLAREVSVFENHPLLEPSVHALTSGKHPVISAHIAPHAPSSRLSLVSVKVNSNPVSPWWMQRRLILAGMRPLNALVDVTNYVMLELGQPLHAYNVSSLQQQAGKLHFQAEAATATTPFVTLDGSTRTIEPEDCMITVNGKPAGIAGIMGGNESSIQTDTREVVLEAAAFHGPQIRRTSRRLGLRTEASTRFEKGVDPEGTTKALARAVQLLTELGIVEQVSGLIDERITQPKKPLELTISTQLFESLMGLRIGITDAKRILERLGFKIHTTSKTTLRCSPPSWRADILLEEDVIEELVRMWGYERIPLTLPEGSVKIPSRNRSFYLTKQWRHTAARLGFQEIISLPFCSHRQLELLGITGALPLDNPLSTEQSHLSPSHLVSFLSLASSGQHLKEQYLFEIGSVFSAPHTEKKMASAFLRSEKPLEELYRQAKQFVVALLPLHTVHFETSETPHPALDAPTCLSVVAHNKTLGTIGVVTPSVVRSHKIRRAKSIVFVELSLDAILTLPEPTLRYLPAIPFPKSERDITLAVAEHTTWSDVVTAIREQPTEILQDYSLENVFRGKSIEGKSLTVRFVYQASDRTLTDEEIEKHQQALIATFRQKLAATIA